MLCNTQKMWGNAKKTAMAKQQSIIRLPVDHLNEDDHFWKTVDEQHPQEGKLLALLWK